MPTQSGVFGQINEEDDVYIDINQNDKYDDITEGSEQHESSPVTGQTSSNEKYSSNNEGNFTEDDEIPPPVSNKVK